MPGECYPFLDDFEICWNVDAQTKKERIDLKHKSGAKTSISCFHTVKAELGGDRTKYKSTEDQPEFDLDTCIIGTKSVAQYFSENGLAAFATQHGVEDLAQVVPWSHQLLPFVAKYNKNAVDLYVHTALDECQFYLEPDQCIHARLEPFKALIPPAIWNEYDADEIAKKMIRDPDFHPKPFQKKLIAHLQTLSLYHNQLASLPESIGQLTELRELSLDQNQLTSLPESIGQLTELRRLDLSQNQITSLPESVGQLAQLRRLSLGNNHITSLPESLGQLTELRVLNLNYNRLTSLPESVGKLAKLRVLHLSDNQLTSLPESIGQLHRLEELDLTGNPITTLPRSLCHNHDIDIFPTNARHRWCTNL